MKTQAFRHAALLLILLCLAATGSAAHAASMDPSLLPQVQSATFEVVAAKPTRDPLSYARKLPLDLLPYQERTDKYYSIGTAFAIGKNRYVTAAHVLMVGLDSLWGPPSLRDSAGKVYQIGKIEQFSQRRDFVTFSLVDPPSVSPYPTNTRATLNQAVYAVGNALGTGVVIRDGLYTSDTPESLSGSWKWMRFSAAASPGNSGGPLLDSKGRVIGLVLMKSANENLNYALPIGEVLDAPPHEAVIKQRLGYRFIVFDRTLHNLFEARFKLPLSLEDFFATYANRQQAYTDSQLKKLLTTDQDNMFPHGEQSEALLHGGTRMINYPSLVVRGDNGDWHLSDPNKTRVKLDDNGYIEIGTFHDSAILFHLRKPDSISAKQLYHEPERLMKLIAATGYLKRSVGNDQVKITSLGQPVSDQMHVDKWQRPWQVRTWPIPYQNSIAMVMALPTPDGYSGIMYVSPATRKHDFLVNMKALADFAYVTYDGSLAQWRDFLKQGDLLPAAFADIHVDFDYEQHFSYRSRRLDLTYSPELQPIRADSMFTLGFSFFRDGDAVVWDVADVWAAPDAYDDNAINIARQSRPTDALGNDYQSVWRKISKRKHPFDAVPRLEDDIMKISSVAGPPADAEPDVLYSLYFYHDGKQTDAFMKKHLRLLESGLKLH